MNVPNLICYFRVLLCLFSFWYYLQTGNKTTFFLITAFVIYLDALDGYLARKLNQATEFGAKLDIISDRLIELFYWLFFAYIGVLHIWVFYFFLARGVIVDYLTRHSAKPLGDSFLRSSRVMRGLYGSFKLISFSALILCPYHVLFANIPIAHIIVYITVVLCFLRGLPVVLDQFKKD